MTTFDLIWMTFVYLIAGYIFTQFFYYGVLNGKGWADCEFGGGSAIAVTLAWPFMLCVIFLVGILYFADYCVARKNEASFNLDNLIRRLYSLPLKTKD